ncbi:MAG: RluA family pseudouridine synthase [Bdellovibrionales bacterium]|nr:RluA family pseudouridine synthase [Bdellovibrionales bacterium]
MNPGSSKPPLKFKVIHRDSFCLCAHKPHGISTYRESRGGNAPGLKELLEDQLNQRLFPVHRIDADTSGLVLFALDPKSAAAFTRLFKEHKVKKTYHAWCVGETPSKGCIKTPLKKNKSDETESARTDYTRLKSGRGFSLVEIHPYTGRFHQIRRHFDSIGHSLVGDPLYGNPEPWTGFFKGAPRLMLQAAELEFIHPISRKPLKIKTKEPL